MNKTLSLAGLLTLCLFLALFAFYTPSLSTNAWISRTLGAVGVGQDALDAFLEETLPSSKTPQAPTREAEASLSDEAVQALGLSASRAALLSADGRLLWGRNENERAGMASTTKIMTALLAAEYIQTVGYEAETVVTAETAGIEGSSIYLKVGERVRLLDLLYATLLASANDAAATLAVAVAGDCESFVALMNERAACLGLENTHFVNPHGLSDQEHYTTAYELGLLSAHALQNELFATVCATRRYTFSSDGMTRSLSNHHRLLATYEGAIGVKTGFTRATGRCLVSAAERNGVRLIAVTLDAPDDWNDHRALLDFGFSCLESVNLAQVGEFSLTLPVINGEKKTVCVMNEAGLSAVLESGHDSIRVCVELPSFVYASVAQGDTLGRVVFYEGSVMIGSLPLTAQETVEALVYKKTWLEKLSALLGLD